MEDTGTKSISIPLGLPLADCRTRIIIASLEHHNDVDERSVAGSLGVGLDTLVRYVNYALLRHKQEKTRARRRAICGTSTLHLKNSSFHYESDSRIEFEVSSVHGPALEDRLLSGTRPYGGRGHREPASDYLEHGVHDREIRIQLGDTLAVYEKQIVLANLRDYKHQRAPTAAALGITVSQLCDRLKEYGVLPVSPEGVRSETARTNNVSNSGNQSKVIDLHRERIQRRRIWFPRT